MTHIRIFISLISSILFLPQQLYAQWNTNTSINTPICTAVGSQVDSRSIEDGMGGAFIAWKDSRTGVPDIYIQRIDANGIIKWQLNGLPLCTNVADQSTPSITTDMQGGVIVSWSDWRSNVERDLYAQRIDSNGNIKWPLDGAIVTNKPAREHNEKIISDGAGGAIIVWEQQSGSGWDIWAQHLNSSGLPMWQNGGIPVCLVAANKLNPKIQSDNKGGVIITWQDERSVGNFDIFAQRINSTGTLLWGLSGKQVCGAQQVQSNPKIDPDKLSGGAFIAWVDNRNGNNYDVYCQKMDSNGNMLWPPNGVPVCTASGNQSAVDILTNALNGSVILTWKDARFGSEDIYIQKLNASGVPQWILDGRPICNSAGPQLNPNICTNKMGGAIVTWQDSTNTGWDIKAQHIDANGNNVWPTNGATVCNANGTQEDPKNITDGNGGSIFFWKDKRSGINDIYAHKITGFPLAVSNLEKQNKFTVSPNPFTREFTIYIPEQEPVVNITVTDIYGKNIKHQWAKTTSNAISINIANAPIGVYLVHISTSENVITKKIMKY
jgi:hypothetical protein